MEQSILGEVFTVAVRRGFDRQRITLLGSAQGGLGLPALGVLLFELGEQLRVLEGNGGLR